MSRRRPTTPARVPKDTIVVAEPNGSPSKVHPAAVKASIAAEELQEAKLLAYIHDERHISFLRNLHMADFVTMVNGLCGIMSIFNSLAFCLSHPSDYTYLWKALAFPYAGLFADFFDGKVARWRGKSSLLGQELDSLADLVSFGVAPSVLAYTLGLRTNVDTLILSFFLLCGLSRLARFNVTAASLPKDPTGKAKYFEGLPIPTTLGLVTMMSVWLYKGWHEAADGLPWGALGEGRPWCVHVASFVFLGWGCGMVSKSMKVPKL